MRFKFELNDEDVNIIMQTEVILLEDLLVEFTEFLRGCGYVIDYDDEIRIVKSDE